jgi:molybdenum cofactor cytidylyltransferase
VASEPEPAPEPIEPVPLPEPEPARPPADEPAEAAAATPPEPAPAPAKEPAEAVRAEAESRGAEAVLLHPVDHPLTAGDTVDRVVRALEDGALIAVPSHEQRRGHPGGFARAAWPALRAAPPEHGARAVLAAHPEWVVHVAGDPLCVVGIDTPADYERWVSRRAR